jgi:RNA polymerase sigma factor (sigma-70 family)
MLMSSAIESVPAAACSEDDLLGRFVRTGDDQALTELIGRFAPMVYAAARRQVRDPGLADDVVQNVLITFARRVHAMRSGAAIGSWLLRTTRYTAANAMKIESRRRRHEQAAAAARAETDPSPDATAGPSARDHWQAIEPHLDQAMARLASEDQNTVVLRFFQGKSYGEIAAVIGGTEDTARKRLVRAVTRLRKHLLSAGADPAACADARLIVLLASRAVEPVPAQLLAQSTTAAIAAAKVTGTTFLTGVILMTAAKKITVGFILAVLVLGILGVSIFVTHYYSAEKPANNIPPAANAQPEVVAEPAPVDWHPAFYAVYNLASTQPVKYISQGKQIPERQLFYRESMGSEVANAVPYPDRLIFEALPDGTVKQNPAMGPDIFWMSAQALAPGLRTWQIQGDRDLLNRRLTGDWLMRPDATSDQILNAMADALNGRYQCNAAFKHDRREINIVIVSGQIRADCDEIDLPFTAEQSDTVHKAHAYHPSSDAEPIEWTSTTSSILDQVSLASGIAFVMDGSVLSDPKRRKLQGETVETSGSPQQMRDVILQKLREQTGLTLTPKLQTVDVWTLVEKQNESKQGF